VPELLKIPKIVNVYELRSNVPVVSVTVLDVLVPTDSALPNVQVPAAPLNINGKSNVAPLVVIVFELVAANVQVLPPAVNVGELPAIEKLP